MSTPEEPPSIPDQATELSDVPFPGLAGQPSRDPRTAPEPDRPAESSSGTSDAVPDRIGGDGIPADDQQVVEAAPHPFLSDSGTQQVSDVPLYASEPVKGETSAAAPVEPATGPTDSTAVASMICGVTGIIFSCVWGLGAVLGVIAVVMALNARRRLRRPGTKFRGLGMAMTGLVTGLAAILLGGAFLVLFSLLELSA